MKKLYKSVMAILFFAVAAFLSGGCSSTPSESDAQRELESRIVKESKGLIKLVNFTKTNAQFSEKKGVQIYTLEYEATIEFLEDCWWLIGKKWSEYQVTQREPEPAYAGNHVRAGQRVPIFGKVKFEKMERGWRKIRF